MNRPHPANDHPLDIPATMLDYLEQQHVLPLAVCVNQQVWAASVFYALDRRKGLLVFLTDPDTRHGMGAVRHPRVAGTVSDQSLDVASLQGLQLTGIATAVADAELCRELRAIYDRHFPFALGRLSVLWQLQLEYLKLTDNRRGFGHKTSWSRTSTGHSARSERHGPH